MISSRFWRASRSGSGFFVSVGLTALVGVVSVPAIISQAGVKAWASLVLAQAIGAIGGGVVAYGWPVVGPARFAAADKALRGSIIQTSLFSRVLLLIPVLTITLVVLLLLSSSTENTLALALATCTPVLAGLGAAWIFVGEGNPWDLNLRDVAPRLSGIVLGVAAILLTGDLLHFVVFQMLGAISGLALSYSVLSRRYIVFGQTMTWRLVRDAYRDGFAGFVASAVSTTYQNIPLTIVATGAPLQFPLFAMADRLYRIAQLALVPVTQIAQGYVPAASSPQNLAHRVKLALTWGSLTGAMVGALFALLAPWAAQVLSAGTIEVPRGLAISFGVAVAVTLLASIVGRACLVAFGRDSSIALASLVAAGVGVPAVLLGSASLGAIGGALGVAAAEIAGLVVLFASLAQGWRRSID